MVVQLAIFNAGFHDGAIVQAANLALSWDVAAPGALAANVPPDVLRRVGFADPKGKWVVCETGLAGRWAGIFTDRRANTDGTMSLSARSLHELLAAKRTARNYTTGHAPAGEIAQRLLRDAATETTIWIDTIEADEDGSLYAFDSRGDDLLSALDSLASESGQEYDVTLGDDWKVTFAWRKRIGQDKSGQVLLREGAELADVEVSESLSTIVNDMLGVSDASEWPDAASAVAEDPDSIATYGRRQATKRYLGADPQSLEALASSDVAVLAQPVQAFRGTLAADHPVVADIRHGDIVRVWLGTAGYQGTLRVTNRALDVDAGQLVLAGELGVDVA